jgi:hypothetical protein
MATYRLYYIQADKRIVRPPEVVECQDDQEAIQRATQFSNGVVIEVWDRDRMVKRLEPASGDSLAGPSRAGA